jgi:hypothetical protein
MTRTLFIVTAVVIAVSAFGHSESYAAPAWENSAPVGNWYGPGQYDRMVNGSDASTPGHN